MNPLVSIIMPSYNAELYVAKAIASVQAQTMGNWELLVSDDCSSDSTRDIVSEIASNDNRIRLFALKRNVGAAKARNNSLAHARGRYIAYLDADDIWYPNKLNNQIDYMSAHHSAFSCVSYEIIGEDDAPLGRLVHMRPLCDYKGFLLHNLIQTVGVMIDLHMIDKRLLVMPSLRRCEDAATWLQILKAGHVCNGINEVLCCYRRVGGSLSSGKFDGARSIWSLYRNVEHLSLFESAYCFARYAALAFWKRTYKRQNQRGIGWS